VLDVMEVHFLGLPPGDLSTHVTPESLDIQMLPLNQSWTITASLVPSALAASPKKFLVN
jgi:hypothetical protein